MQIENLLQTLLTPPIVYFLLLLVIIILVGAGLKARAGRPKDPTMRKVQKLHSAVEKEKDPPELEVKSRQDIITDIFTRKMNSVGMTPSQDSGYIPTSQTELAKYLKKYNISDDIVDAIQTGLDEVESEEGVRGIIRAAAETKDVNLDGIFLEKAEETAIKEWKRRRGIVSSEELENNEP